jgi:hypothetical protein
VNGPARLVPPDGAKRVPLAAYDGTTPFTGGGPPGTFQGRARAAVTVTFVVVPPFERLGWAAGVHWPVPARLAARRRDSGRDQPLTVFQPGGRRTERAVISASRSLPPLPVGSDRLA